MYWNEAEQLDNAESDEININMRCIEMYQSFMFLGTLYRLTLTWDVLKFCNMLSFYHARWININMRCIEIYITSASDFSFIRLTLTWDVLKWSCSCTLNLS